MCERDASDRRTFRVRKWTSQTQNNDIDVIVYSDDTVGIAKRKIADALGEEHASRVHIWLRSSVSTAPSVARIDDVVDIAICRGFAISDVMEQLRNMFSKEQVEKAAEAEGIDKSTVVDLRNVSKLVRRIRAKFVSSFAGHRWKYNDSFVSLPCNPFESVAVHPLFVNELGHASGNVRVLNENNMLLDSYSSVDDVLDVVAESDVSMAIDAAAPKWKNGFLRIYFPEVPMASSLSLYRDSESGDVVPSTYKEADACIDLIQSLVPKRKWIHESCRLSYAHIRVNENNIRAPSKTSLHDVFYSFRTTPLVPFVMFRSDVDTVFKVHGESLTTLISEQLFDKWIAYRSGSKRWSSYVSWYVYQKDGPSQNYFVVTMHDNLQYDMVYTFEKFHKTPSMATILQSIPRVRAIIDHVRQHVPAGLYVPHVDVDALKHRPKIDSKTKIHSLNFIVLFHDKHARVPSNKEFIKNVKGLRSVLCFIPTSRIDRDGITLQYCRVNNFIAVTDSMQFIKEHSHHNRTLLVRQLKHRFGLSVDQAIQEIEKWNSLRVSMMRDFGTTEYDYIRVRVMCEKTVNITVRVSGCKSLSQLHSILDTVKLCVLQSSDKNVQRRVAAVLQEDNNVLLGRPPSIASIRKTFADSDLAFLNELNLEDLTGQTDEQQNAHREEDSNDELSGEPEDDEEESEHQPDESSTQDTNYVLNHLTRHDPALFAFKSKGYPSYATRCGKVDERQPISMSQEEKDIQDAVDSEAYGTAVLYGSDPANQRWYMCPDVWCPRSKLVMTFDKFKATKSCPLPNEKPIMFESKYWKDHKDARYVGFLKKSMHPKGLCLPCCFKLAREYPECTATENESHTSTRYIKNDFLLLEAGRLAVLPSILDGAFQNRGMCGNRPDGSGTLGTSSDCIARMGMPQTSSPFVDTIAWLMDSTPNRVRSSFTNVTINDFVTLQNGHVFRMYVQLVRRRNNNRPENEPSLGTARRRRDELIEQAWELFKMDVTLESNPRMNHTMLQDLVYISLGIKTIVISINGNNVSASCPNAQIDNEPVALLLYIRDTNVYNPIVRVKLQPSQKKGDAVNIEKLHRSDDKRLEIVVNAARQACGASAMDAASELIAGIERTLAPLGNKIDRLVLDYDGFFACGAILESDNMFLPFPTKVPLVPHYEWIFMDDVPEVHVRLRASHVERVIKHIRDYTGHDGFRITEKLLHNNKIVALVGTGKLPIPLDNETFKHSPYVAEFHHARNSMLQIPPDDPVIVSARANLEIDALIDRMIPYYFHVLSKRPDIFAELRFLKSDHNPFPLEMRRSRASRLLEDMIGDIEVSIPANVVDEFIRRCVLSIFQGIKHENKVPVGAFPGELMLTSVDIEKIKSRGMLTYDGIMSYISGTLMSSLA